MTPTATTVKPTLEEQVQGLKETAARLAAERDDLLENNRQLRAERDVALKMAGQATKNLVRVRDEVQARLDGRDVLISSLRADDDSKNADLRRLNARVHELAVENEALRKQRDKDQQEPKPVRRNWLSKRIGNQL